MYEQAGTCTRCGARYEEWVDDPDAWVIHARRCPGCEKIEWEQDSRREDKEKGMQIHLVRPGSLPPVILPKAMQ